MITLKTIARPTLFGRAPSQAQDPPGGFVILNLKFVIYLLFGICDLEFSAIHNFPNNYVLNNPSLFFCYFNVENAESR
jgi:hypothetical protein